MIRQTLPLEVLTGTDRRSVNTRAMDTKRAVGIKSPAWLARLSLGTARVKPVTRAAHMSEAEVLVLSRKGKLREQSLKMQFSSQVIFFPFLWLSSDDRMLLFGGLTKG